MHDFRVDSSVPHYLFGYTSDIHTCAAQLVSLYHGRPGAQLRRLARAGQPSRATSRSPGSRPRSRHQRGAAGTAAAAPACTPWRGRRRWLAQPEVVRSWGRRMPPTASSVPRSRLESGPAGPCARKCAPWGCGRGRAPGGRGACWPRGRRSLTVTKHSDAARCSAGSGAGWGWSPRALLPWGGSAPRGGVDPSASPRAREPALPAPKGDVFPDLAAYVFSPAPGSPHPSGISRM